MTHTAQTREPPAAEISNRRRVLVFAVLGPPIGMVALLVLAPFVLSGSLQPDAYEMQYLGGALPVLLFIAYFLGIIPSLLAALADYWLQRVGLSSGWRVAGMAVCGGLLSLLPVLVSIIGGFLTPYAAFTFAISGIVAGAACSALTAMLRKAGTPS